VLTKVFGRYGDEVTGVWRRLHNEEFYDLYLANIIWVIVNEVGEASSTYGG
jgi:hypothetical protein